MIVPAVALALYLFNVILSVYKPWGRRKAAGARPGRIPGASGAAGPGPGSEGR
ncbi:hypothetical protein AB0F71_22215 [Kitasatospora sp. NPDC028055]|uniref:hypothetical protein n=1 Tax=Kitasatospora sp. NPDC028055 TaxID=3155653 RepID=UPI0033FE57B4